MRVADSKIFAYAASAALLAVVLSPVLRPAGYDSFPLSSYPMFARGRADTIITIDHLVGKAADGGETFLPPRLVGTDEVLQARATLERIGREGVAAKQSYCQEVAARVTNDDELARVVEVQFRRDTYDAIDYLTTRAAPRASSIHARCAVRRAGSRD